ncbi:9-cis-epoxycarotenoid dioxygenase NCED6 [Cucumis melo var. makuwa]|uniref:9-cis-epoxycarotenoid dioxygenase NCED6 n=1 Tax=Cucumis melo var. makuwa TaxID=1194695 RepID=A0A5A7UUY3_CUCMM|nr:9-cis-epoxycarotenoid dioxygenase NCED6 [Cucumis melo var. makuwa]TYK30044.1 9-cis-epoxycarotenoid dioxygenase NCED6 [Cucumis melo var. makuwa]
MYNNIRNAIMVENFLFGHEQYYQALKIVDDGAKIGNALNFLCKVAQLWWRRKHVEWEKDPEVLIDISSKEKKTRIDEGDVSEPKKEGNSKQDGKHAKALFANKDTAPRPCFLCNGPYWVRDCRKKNKLSAMVANPHKGEEIPMKGST